MIDDLGLYICNIIFVEKLVIFFNLIIVWKDLVIEI